MNTSRLRNFSAIIITVSGVSHIAELWLRELNTAAILNALLGAIYLFIGIGLFGKSRFALFLAAVVPSTTAVLAVNGYVFDKTANAAYDTLVQAQWSAELFAAALCAIILFTVRNNPSI